MWNWHNEESGQGMVEYALILALIALVVVIALSSLGTKVFQYFNDMPSKFPN